MGGSTVGSCSGLLAATAGRCRELLDAEATQEIAGFIRSQMNDDGGFRGRGETSDLYYTLFALECLQALGERPPIGKVASFLDRFGDGRKLDLVHLTCLARCLSRLPATVDQREANRAILRRLDQLRLPDGGYRLHADDSEDSIYACFLAVLAHEENGFDLPDRHGIRRCIDRLRAGDGAWGDRSGLATGTTTVTVAAVTLLALLGEPIDPAVGGWLLSRRGPHGGFHANADARVPDLLSTATSLVALQVAGVSLPEAEQTRSFVEALWDDESGGFNGHPFDDAADCEYTYYGLLSLGAIGEA